MLAVMLCTLGSYISYIFDLSFISVHRLLPILILNWWFMISDTIKKQSWFEYRQNLAGKLPKKIFFPQILLMDSIFLCNILIIFEKFGHLKDGPQSCLAQSDLQESVNLQSIKNRIHKMIFSRYTQDSGNITSCRVGDINSQFFQKSCPLDLIARFTAPSHISSCKLTCLSR